MSDLVAVLEPGMLVRNVAAPEWGVGQVQSNVANKVTVNFREMGKVVMDGTRADLELVYEVNN
ncbi:DUF3553 domain-containing protein [Pseudaestuariivita atlantica]|uniref:DUF3553 domain-containing protein n=1 Tax=Pseudaestuariivita atlantica TaxID=1317121 RepID=A0A0L1JTB5_9RHOB|nr:DUF3553 domain-containing protein [Pseudaestuariivita atlantica]KNG95014.1 hypothetical protein ATO11_06545 [Pseudaestuariivita atlantica]